MHRSISSLIARGLGVVAVCSFVGGCAGMVVGSAAWFEKKRADVEPAAQADLQCSGTPLEFRAVTMNDYRDVEARGCGKKVRYQLVKVSFVEKWVKASDVTKL